MAKYDLIAFDMDGTLLNSDKEIREDSKEAILFKSFLRFLLSVKPIP